MSSYKAFGKRYRLSSGLILELWPKDKRNPEICQLAILGVLGGHKVYLRFTKEDIPTIEAALAAALDNNKTWDDVREELGTE